MYRWSVWPSLRPALSLRRMPLIRRMYASQSWAWKNASYCWRRAVMLWLSHTCSSISGMRAMRASASAREITGRMNAVVSTGA